MLWMLVVGWRFVGNPVSTAWDEVTHLSYLKLAVSLFSGWLVGLQWCIFPTVEQFQEAYCRVSLSYGGRDQNGHPETWAWSHGIVPRISWSISVLPVWTQKIWDLTEFSGQICTHSGTVWKAFLWPKNYFSVTHSNSTMRGLTLTRIKSSLGVQWLYFW